MINATGSEVLLNGSFKDLISEAARILHALGNTADRELDDVDYDEIIRHILIELAALKQFTGSNSIPEELELEFFKQLEDYKREHGDDPDWIEFNSGNPFVAKKNPIQTSLKGFIMDPRIQEEFDFSEEDIEKPKKKKKGKKK